MYNIYYAHHQWKYGTKIEKYELDLIKKYFPNATIFNPSTDLIIQPGETEEDIMWQCLQTVRNSDILVFSSMDGVIGTGVYHEIAEAKERDKIIFYIYKNALQPTFTISKLDDDIRSDRVYGTVSGCWFQ